MPSASAPSSVNLAPTKIRQVRRPVKHVQPILTVLLKLQVVTTMPPAVRQEHMLVEQRPCAMLVKLGNTMIKLERLIAKFVELANTITKHNAQQNPLANLIATPDHTSHLTKVHVSFVRKVSGKIKIDSQIAQPVTLENITSKRNEQQNPTANIVTLENTTVLMIRQRKTNMTRKLIASHAPPDKLRMAKQPNLIVRPVQQDGI